MSNITITEAAQAYLADLLSKQNVEGIGIRVFITQPGTQYAETCIAYCKPGEQKAEDTAFALKDFTAWIDAVFFSGVDQHQPRGPESAADSGSRRRAFAILRPRSAARSAPFRALDGTDSKGRARAHRSNDVRGLVQ